MDLIQRAATASTGLGAVPGARAPIAISCVLLAAALALPLAAAAQGPQPVPAGAAPAAQRPGAARAPSRPIESRPAWAELTGDQQQALRPLAAGWNTLTEAHKRKWLALTVNFRTMAPDEQGKLHSRMNDWVALSPQQRAQARLNFGETHRLSADDKKAKWEAYQALSPDEKRKLAAGAAPRTPPTAAAVRPVPPQKLANLPRGRGEGKPPRIAAGPTVEPAGGLLPGAVGMPPPQAN